MFFNELKNSTFLVSEIQDYVDKLSSGLCKSSSSIDEYNKQCNSISYYSSTPIDNELFINTIDSFNSSTSTSSASSSRAITKRVLNDGNANSSSSFESNNSMNGSTQYMMNSNNRSSFKKQLPIRSAAIDMSGIIEKAKNSKQCKKLYCTFCKSNGESEDVYKSHLLKDLSGRVTCPVLKLHVCPICRETGENAHTITYCKEYKKSKRFELLQSALDTICKH